MFALPFLCLLIWFSYARKEHFDAIGFSHFETYSFWHDEIATFGVFHLCKMFFPLL